MAQRKLATLIAAVAVGAACAVLSACFQQLSFVGNSKAVPVSVGLAPGSVVSQRPAGTSRNAVDILLKQRINAVKKTSKVTDAMRLIAASKVRKAQDGVEQTRPFSTELQGMIKGIVKKLKGTGLEAELPMLRVAENIKSIAILTITSSRGLCGAYNSFVMKKLGRRVKALNEQVGPFVVSCHRLHRDRDEHNVFSWPKSTFAKQRWRMAPRSLRAAR